MNEMTIAKALKQRKSLAEKLSLCQQRIIKSSVWNEGEEPDFNVEEVLKEMEKTQSVLRNIKTSVALASVTSKIKIPEGCSCKREIPIYEAVLLRDDLKCKLSLLKKIIDIPLEKPFTYREQVAPPNKIRTFNFAETLKEIERIQDWIDEIDSRIQFADNTEKIQDILG